MLICIKRKLLCLSWYVYHTSEQGRIRSPNALITKFAMTCKWWSYCGCRATSRALLLLNLTNMGRMRGCFLLHANHTHGKVHPKCLYVISIKFFESCGQFIFMRRNDAYVSRKVVPDCLCTVSRSPKRFWWCSGILFSRNTWTYPTYFSAPTHAVCGECCWVWGLYRGYWILETKFCSSACKCPFENILIGALYFCFLLLQTSNTHKQMIEIFAKTGFVTQEYILTPLQFGVPYSRPRYFCLVNYFSLFLFTLG